MNAETYLQVMLNAETKKLSESVYRFFSHLCLKTNNVNKTTLTNEVLINNLKVSERTISSWLSKLEETGLVNVIHNRHKHERIIYINGTEAVKGFVEPSYECMSQAQRKFKDRYPNRAIDCEVPENVDMDRLLEEMELSKFLKTCENMSLKSCVIKHYDLILKGFWRDSEYKIPQRSNFSTGRNYTREEMNSLFQNIEDFEVV